MKQLIKNIVFKANQEDAKNDYNLNICFTKYGLKEATHQVIEEKIKDIDRHIFEMMDKRKKHCAKIYNNEYKEKHIQYYRENRTKLYKAERKRLKEDSKEVGKWKAWSISEENKLVKYREAGLTYKELGRVFERSIDSVKERLKIIKKRG